MGDVGAPELLIILVVILVLFGGAKLPEFARSLGKAKHEFQKGVDEGMRATSEVQPVDASADEHSPAATAPIATPPIDTSPVEAPPIEATAMEAPPADPLDPPT